MQVPDSVKAAAPAIASIAGGLSVYRWRENWIRCESTAEKMNAERMKFRLITSDYKDEKTASEVFLSKILEINYRHLKQWRTENEVDPDLKEQSSEGDEEEVENT